jgi:[ribosomal protein S18]-alanine N-acetyltransferase
VPFAVRDFKPEDFETLWRIDQDCFPPGISYSRQELKVYMRRRGSFTLVAVEVSDGQIRGDGRTEAKITRDQIVADRIVKDKIAGFIVAHGGSVGHIITIDVISAARRARAGSLLLQGAEDRMRGSGSHAVSLETAVDNRSALAFYKRHGYSVTGTIPRYYPNGVDALVLTKNLA